MAAWENGLQVIDITNPQSPAIAGSVDTPGKAADVYVSGSYAYVADNESGLQVIDISIYQGAAVMVAVETPAVIAVLMAVETVVLSPLQPTAHPWRRR